MKVFVAILLIFIIMTVAIFVNTAIMSGIIANMERYVDKLPSPDSLEIPSEITVYDIEKEFSDNEFYLSLSMSHDDIGDVSKTLASLIAAYESKDSDSYREQIYLLKDAIQHLKRLASVSWDNIV
jgi:hypothetical protein